MNHHISKHLPPTPVFGVAPEKEGWLEKPGSGRITRIRSIVLSDGSSVRRYQVEAVKKKVKMKPEVKITPITEAEAKKRIKRARRKMKVKELR